MMDDETYKAHSSCRKYKRDLVLELGVDETLGVDLALLQAKQRDELRQKISWDRKHQAMNVPVLDQ